VEEIAESIFMVEVLNIPKDSFICRDLAEPSGLIDIRLSLVPRSGEHLQSDCAETFVDSIRGWLGMLFSAAIPAQGGTGTRKRTVACLLGKDF